MSKIEREWDSISSWQASQSVLISKKSPKHTQSCQIWSNTKISNNPAKYEVLLNRTWVQSWTLISETAVRRFRINHKILCNKTDIWQSVLNVQHRRWSIYGLCTAKKCLLEKAQDLFLTAILFARCLVWRVRIISKIEHCTELKWIMTFCCVLVLSF